MHRILAILPALLGAACQAPSTVFPAERGELLVSRDEWRDRLVGFWLAQCIGNWTGLRSEGLRTGPPFFTDGDWGREQERGPLEFVIQDPWQADDDTDLEYLLVHQMARHGPMLTPEQFAAGWRRHVPGHVWVSNARARALMDRGVLPPATSLPAANRNWLMIDAQLTTEVCGVLAPGLPSRALALGEVPMRATARGHALHAAQFFAVLHALVPRVPADRSPAEQVEWLVRRGRRFLPDSSKAAGVVDHVLAAWRRVGDADDWERVRDAIAVRYQVEAGPRGFVYRGWTESSVNLATGVLCLLAGQGDLRRTIRIGTLSGWDSDNPTATAAGLLGLMHGRAGVERAFPRARSLRYHVSERRPGLPDRLPEDPGAEDRFDLLAERMLGIVDRVVAGAGGGRDARGWRIPLVDLERVSLPYRHRATTSATVDVRTFAGAPVVRVDGATADVPQRLADGVELDPSGREVPRDAGLACTLHPEPEARLVEVTVSYPHRVPVRGLRCIEGDHPNGRGLEGAEAWVRSGEAWRRAGAWVFDPEVPFENVVLELDEPVHVRAIRLAFTPEGRSVGLAELDGVLEHPVPN